MRAGATAQLSLQHLEHAIHILKIWFDGLSLGDELAMVKGYDSRIDCNIVIIKKKKQPTHTIYLAV